MAQWRAFEVWDPKSEKRKEGQVVGGLNVKEAAEGYAQHLFERGFYLTLRVKDVKGKVSDVEILVSLAPHFDAAGVTVVKEKKKK